MLASDPRTWTDFRNPELHGFEKVDCDTTLERAFIATGITCVSLVFAVLWFTLRGLLYRSRWRLHLPPSAVPLLVPGLAAAAGMSVALRWLTDNFYLIDSSRHAVYYRFEFLFVRRVTLLLEPQDIDMVIVESRRRRDRGHIWFEYRRMLIATDGRSVPMSNWERYDRLTSNERAADLAKTLGCRFSEVPLEDP